MRRVRDSTVLDGKVVLVTGGARGIGRATARSLLRRGARVAVGDVDRDALNETAAALGDGALALHLDVTDEQSFADFIAVAEERLGPVDVLINNAGVMPLGRFHEQSAEAQERTLAINVGGMLRGMRLVLGGMADRGGGQIINVASVAGKAPSPGGLAYSATKAAVVLATETARVEYANTGIKFTCVMPSFTNTELIAGTAGTRFVDTVEPEDVAEAIAKAVVRPRNDVYAPSSVGKILWLYPIIGRRLRDALARAIRADRVFLEADSEVRAAYDARRGLTRTRAAAGSGEPRARKG